jgi:modification methylase
MGIRSDDDPSLTQRASPIRALRATTLARANLTHAEAQGATGKAAVFEGDARQLERVLARARRHSLEGEEGSAVGLARRAAGGIDLILTSPPYACEIQMIDKPAWLAGGSLGDRSSRNYSADRANLGHARGDTYRTAMADVYAACAAVLKPGGFLVVVTKNLRAGGELYDLAGDTIRLCRQAGLRYWQQVIALHAAIRDSTLVPRPSFWQLSTIRKANARRERLHLPCHEDVLVFRKPAERVGSGRLKPPAPGGGRR